MKWTDIRSSTWENKRSTSEEIMGTSRVRQARTRQARIEEDIWAFVFAVTRSQSVPHQNDLDGFSAQSCNRPTGYARMDANNRGVHILILGWGLCSSPALTSRNQEKAINWGFVSKRWGRENKGKGRSEG
jgi:hypothetical protein